MAAKGRHWLALWLVALLAALWVVIARQTASLNAARALADLRAERAALEGRRGAGAAHPHGGEPGGAVAAGAAPRSAPARRQRDRLPPRPGRGGAVRARHAAAALTMAKPIVRLAVVQAGLLAALAVLVLRAAQVQLLEGRRHAAEAAAQRTEHVVLEARRGTLFDRHGTALALTQETYHVGLAPNELRDPRGDTPLLARQLRVSARELDRALRRRYAWFSGPYTALEVEPLRAVRGVHLEPVLRRFYPSAEFARAVIGRVGDDGLGASGLERLLDTLLAGAPGAAVVLKDRAGREYESPARLIAEPVAGSDVVLTLDAELQEIAQRALDDALDRMNAEGGDVVMLDPVTGEALAVASRRRDGSAHPSAFTDTFEPGSLAKIFAAGALLAHGRVRLDERVSGEGGTYRIPGGPRR